MTLKKKAKVSTICVAEIFLLLVSPNPLTPSNLSWCWNDSQWIFSKKKIYLQQLSWSFYHFKSFQLKKYFLFPSFTVNWIPLRFLTFPDKISKLRMPPKLRVGICHGFPTIDRLNNQVKNNEIYYTSTSNIFQNVNSSLLFHFFSVAALSICHISVQLPPSVFYY